LAKSQKQISKTPAALGYRMPAEWEAHEATWIAWPHNRSDWPGKFAAIPWVYAEIVRNLARVERVNILVNNETEETKARNVLVTAEVLPKNAEALGSRSGNVKFWHIPTNRAWMRDTGPIFLRRGARASRELPPLAATAWRFNAWAKYNDWKRDAPVSSVLGRRLRIPTWQPEIEIDGECRRVVLEGGSIDVNGRGTLLTTEECLLGKIQQRNPGVSRQHLEQLFADYLGIRKVIWLGRGIAGDDTRGHVDDISRFVAPNVVVTAYEPDTSDANYKPLRENLLQLKKSSDQSGRPLRIVKLPMPTPAHFNGQRLPASYANFYIANRLVLVPVFNDASDRVALNILADVFPGRTVVPIHCGDFILGLGALHCITQQQPAV
jgi:agmatine deiminase